MNKLTNSEITVLIEKLKVRFENNMNRHLNIRWEHVLEKLNKNKNVLNCLNEMEKTGGEPDVVAFDKSKNEYIFYDCSKESPLGRRSLCYDREALESRKKFKPINSAKDMAKEMGIEILNEEEYKYLQQLGDFDLKSSSWIDSPIEIRKQGGALFGDKRYNNTYIYHNGADSYYSGRGFRGLIRL